MPSEEERFSYMKLTNNTYVTFGKIAKRNSANAPEGDSDTSSEDESETASEEEVAVAWQFKIRNNNFYGIRIQDLWRYPKTYAISNLKIIPLTDWDF